MLLQNTYFFLQMHKICVLPNTYNLCLYKIQIVFLSNKHIFCAFAKHIYFVFLSTTYILYFFSGLEVAHDQIRNPLDCSWIEWLKLIKMAKRLDGWQDLKKRADRSSCPGRPIRCRIKPRHPQMDETMYFFKPWSSGGPHLLSLH